MAQFDIGNAWSEAMAFLRDNFQLLLVLVGGGAVFAGVAQYLGAGGIDQTAQMAALQSAVSSGDWAKIAQAGAASPMGIGGGLMVILAAVVQGALQFAALRLGLTPGDDVTGSAIVYGLVATLATFLFYFAAALIAAIAIIVPLVALGIGGGASGMGGGVVALLAVLALVFFIAVIWVVVRLSVIQPAMAAARSANPLYGIAESWRLTSGNALMIFVYSLLLGVAALVITLVGGLVLGGIGGLMGATAAMILTTIFLSAPLAVVGTAISAGIYRTLAPDTRGDIFA